MIDWITCKVPMGAGDVCERSELLRRAVAFVGGDGTIESLVPRWNKVRGSYESSMQVRGVGTFLHLDGNPAKFLQGHNLFGSNDLHALTVSTALRVCRAVGIEPTKDEIRGWQVGYNRYSRVDCTEMLRYLTRADVSAVLRACEGRARSRHGAAVSRGGTVYLGLGSRRWTLKFYGKGDELESGKKGHGLPSDIEHQALLNEYADTALRVELQMRGMELEARGLRWGQSWTEETAMEQLRLHLESVEMGELTELPSDVLAELPGRLVSVYRAWQHGDDLRALYCRPTFYKYRRELLAHGIDIAARCRDAAEPNNVLPFRRVLEGRWVGVPDWALGTSLYFDPAADEELWKVAV